MLPETEKALPRQEMIRLDRERVLVRRGPFTVVSWVQGFKVSTIAFMSNTSGVDAALPGMVGGMP